MQTQNPKQNFQKIIQNLHKTIKTITNPVTNYLYLNHELQKSFKKILDQILYFLKHSSLSKRNLVFDLEIKEQIQECWKLLEFWGDKEKYLYNRTLFRFVFRRFVSVFQRFRTRQANIPNIIEYPSNAPTNNIQIQPNTPQKPQNKSLPHIPQTPIIQQTQKKYLIKIIKNLHQNTTELKPKLISQLQKYILYASNQITTYIKISLSELCSEDMIDCLFGYHQFLYKCVLECLASIRPLCRYSIQVVEGGKILVRFQGKRVGRLRYVFQGNSVGYVFYCLGLGQDIGVIQGEKMYDMLGKVYRKAIRKQKKFIGRTDISNNISIQVLISQQPPSSPKQTQTTSSSQKPKQTQQKLPTSAYPFPQITIPTSFYKYPNIILLLSTKPKYIEKFTNILSQNNYKYQLCQPIQGIFVGKRSIWLLCYQASLISIKIILKLCQQQQQIKPSSIKLLPVTKTLQIEPKNQQNQHLHNFLQKLSKSSSPNTYTIINLHPLKNQTNNNEQYPTIITYNNYKTCLESYFYLVGLGVRVQFQEGVNGLEEGMGRVGNFGEEC